MADVNMRILLQALGGAQVVNAISGIARAASGGSGSLAGALSGVALAAGGAAVALGAVSVKTAADFQQAMLKVQALAGLSIQQSQQMSDSILKMATTVGKSPKELADGLYYVASAGYRGADALNILKLSAEAAATGNFDMKTAADALTSAMNAFGVDASSASYIMDQMTATVSAGKLEWSSYANVVGKLSVISRASNVSFAEANAALATLTNSGYSARQAGTSLGNLFTQLDLKTDSLAKNAKKLNIAFDEQKFKSMSLAQQIQYLTSITGGNQTELLKLMNNNATALKTFDALSNSLGTYQHNLQAVSDAHGATATKFAITQQGFNQSMARLNAAGQVLLITIGSQLLPILTRFVGAIIPVVSSLATWLNSGNRLQNALHTLGTAIKNIAGFIMGVVSVGIAIVGFFQRCQIAALALLIPLGALGGYFVFLGVSAVAAFIAAAPAMIAGFIAGAAAAWAMAAGVIAATWPFLLLGAAIGLIIGLVVLVVQHWSSIVGFLQRIWNQIKDAAITAWNAIVHFLVTVFSPVVQFFQMVWNAIVTVLTVAWNIIKMAAFVIFVIIVDLIILPFLPLIDWFKAHWTQIQAVLMIVWNAIKAVAAALWDEIKQRIITPVKELFGALQTAWNAISKAATTAWSLLVKAVKVEWNAFVSMVQGPINTVMSWLESAWKRISTAARSAWKGLADDIGAIFSGIIGGIKWVINHVIDLINGIIGDINSISSHVGIPAIPSIPHLATGGITTRGGLVEVGERGAEVVALPAGAAVYPHGSVPASAAGGGPTTIINISISTMARSQSEVRRMVDMFEHELGVRIRNITPGYNAGGVF